MILYFSSSSLISFLVIAIALYFSCNIWARRPNRGAAPFALFIISIVGWTLFRLLESAAEDLDSKIILAKLMYLFLASAAIWWLAFASDYIGLKYWKNPLNLLLLYALPVLSVFLVTTFPWHHIEWLNIRASFDSSGLLLLWEKKLFFWVQAAYLLVLIFIGYFFLWKHTLIRRGVFRRQIVALLIGTLVPVLSIILFNLNLGYIYGYDIILAALTFGVGVYALTIFRFQFLDVVPVARGTLVEKMPDGILVLDKSGTILDINPSVEKTLKLKKGDATGRTLDRIWPQLDLIYDKLRPGESVEIITRSQTYLEINLTDLADSHGRGVGKLIVVRDITERKLTQQKLESLYREEKKLRGSLQSEMEKRIKYTRALVHELNTPLTSILVSGEMLETTIEEPTLLALVKNIRRASNNLKQRIDELIELARGEIGTLKINAMPLDMDRLLKEIESEMKPLALGKGLEMTLEIIGELPLAMGDRGRLRQVLYNLIGNALKFTQSGCIHVKGEQVGELVKVTVRDTGRGISREEMEYLFDPYLRKRNEGQELSGLGIGLTLSKMFVELHGGKIEVVSDVEKGSTFSFTIPVYKQSDLINEFN
jgi:PAS domain S-box-containing protein